MKIRNFFIVALLLMLNISANAQMVEIWKNGYPQYTYDSPDSIVFRPYTTAELEAKMNIRMSDLYFCLNSSIGRRMMELTCLSSDEWTSLSYYGNWVDGYSYAHPSYHTSNPKDATIDWLRSLEDANNLANEVLSSSFPSQHKASARAIRAFNTFIMMDFWGDAPIDAPDFSNENNHNPNYRVPRPMVAKWIEKELLDIYDKLPEATTGDNYGKPNKYMALALLAKLYINWPVYTAQSVDLYDAASAKNEKLEDCIKICDQIINSGKFDLGPDPYRFKFSHDNTSRVQAGTIKDFIYAMKYDTNGLDGTLGMQWGRSHVYKDIKSMYPSYFGEKLNNSGGGYMTVTPECVDRFNLPGDERNFMLAGLCDKDGNDANGQVYVYDPVTLLPTVEKALDRTGCPLVFTKNINITGDIGSNDSGDNLEGWRQGYRSVKWFLCNTDYSNGRNQSNDVPIFRYADILLTKAEALIRSNKTGATELFNQIRSYVNAPIFYSEPTLNDIYEERGREFFDELWRRNDMIRFGHYEDNWFPHYKTNQYANFDKRMRIFPVPDNMLNSHPTWTQNPGY